MKQLYPHSAPDTNSLTEHSRQRPQPLRICWWTLCCFTCLSLGTVGHQAWAQAPQVVTVVPSRNAIAAGAGTNVAVTFSQPMQAVAASAAGLRVFSSQRGGLLTGTYGGAGTATATFQPAQNLRPGETVQVCVKQGTLSTTGQALPMASLAQFTVGTTPSAGTFGLPGQALAATPYTYGVAAADFNGDGNLDLASCSQYTTSKVQIRFGRGDGTFGSAFDYAMGASYFLTSADLDNDGDLDLVVGNYGQLVVMRNNGSGVFTSLRGFPTGNDVRTIVPADMNGDGNLDVVVACASSGSVFVHLGQGDGTFSTAGGSYFVVTAPVGVAVGDVDGDGDLDYVTAGAQSNRAFVRLNDGTGNFPAGSTLTVGFQPNSIALGDLNGDGALDVVTANQNSSNVSVLLNTNAGTGTFQAATTVNTANIPTDVKLGDVDGDGDLDLVVGGYNRDVRLNNGIGVFSAGPLIPFGAYYVVLADVNNDGTLDLLSGSGDSLTGSVGVCLNAATPTLTSFSPASGPIGSSVVLTGTNLAGTTQVAFNGRPAASFAVNSATSVTAVVPAGATSGRIGVTTLPGMSTTSATNFTIPAPIVTSLSPAEGPAGTVVTVMGTGFLDATQVTFAGTVAAGFVVNAAGTQLTVAAPAGVSTGPVVATTPNGTSNGVQFTGAPALSGISPAFGPAGTVVTLTGGGLLNASAVTFGGVAAPGFTVNAAGTSLSVSAPVGVLSGPVLVTTPYGVSNGLTFTGAPVITSFSPAAGTAGTRVTVQGLNFTGANQVTFGTATTTTFAVISATQLSVTVPSGASTGPIRVRTSAGTAVSTTSYTIPAPVLTALTPASGPASTNVTITGTDLVDVTGVTFNGVPASYFYTNSATSVSAYAPYGVTTGPVVVTTPGGPSNGLLFTAAPVISSFSPTGGSPGTLVTLTGQNLTGTTQVSFNGVAAGSYTVVSATQLTATVPVGAITGPIRVTTPAGTAVSNNYFYVTAPILTAIAPSAGPAGTVVTLTGSNLLGLTGVTFNGLAAPGATVDATGTQVTVTAPTGVTTGPVVAITGTGPSNGLLFSSAPTLTALSPAFGPAGTPVTLTGTGLTGTTQVTFNGTVAPGFVVNAAGTQLTVTAPAGLTTGPVVAANAYGAGNGLVFTLPPAISGLNPASSPVGSSVVVTGTDLTGATRVTVNATAAASFTVNSATQLTFVVPAGATSGLVRVTTPAGTAISPTGLVVPAPVLTTLSPSAGPLGSSVAIAGSSLRDASRVTFNGTSATGFVVNTAGTLLTVTVPAGATTGPVLVTTPNGLSNGLTFTVGPTITSLSPAFGGPGTQVTITGSNFTGTTLVTFNGTASPGFVVNAAGTSLTVTAPAGVTTGPVVVTAAGTASNGVLYTAAPVIMAFTPTSGIIGTSVTIAGTDLNQPTQVLFNGVSASFTAGSATQLTAIVPVGARTGPVQVVTAHGSGASAANFTVPAPVLTGVAPAAAAVGATITLTGSNLQGTTGLTFGSVAASGYTVNPAGTSLTVTVPTGATGGPLVLMAPHGSSNGLAFAVLPAITSVTPATAVVGTQVTIMGTTFGGATQVSFNGVTAAFAFVSATQLTAVVPAGATSGALRVTTATGTSAAFTFAVPPTLVQLAPAGNSRNVLPTASVTASFSRAVSTATAGQAGLRVFGSQSLGLLPGTYVGSGTSTVAFTPSQALRAGEVVQATVLATAAAADGTPVNRPYVAQFTTATGPAPGTFVAGSQYLSTTGSTTGVAVGDFDRDGYPDVAASSSRTSPTAFLTIYYGDATGTFARSYSVMLGAATYLTSVDVDNDGDLDLLATKPLGGAEVWRNDGIAGFTFLTTIATPNSLMTVAADLNGDGNQDLLISCNYGGAFSCLGRGDGTFGPISGLITGRIMGLAAGDVDGDGDLDVVMANASGNNVAIRLNNGAGSLAAPVLVPVANAPSAVALGDVTGDGVPDLLVTQYDYGTTTGQSSVVVLTNNGTGTFTVGASVAIGGHPLDVKLGDVDGDGDLDAVTVNEASATASVCLNQGQGTFALTTTVPVGSGPTSLVLADLDGNRTLDLVTANAASTATQAVLLVFNKPARYVWTGAVSSNWNTPGNWQSGLVPTAATDAVIPAGLATYPVLNSGPQAVSKLTVAAGATLTLPATATLRVSGDWEHNGSSQLLGSVVFAGAATQLLTGTTAPSFATLEVDKSAGMLALQRAATVTGALRMTASRLLTGNTELTTSGATLSETETSYVQGTVVSTTDVQTTGTRYTFGNLGLSLTPSGPGLPGSTTVRRVTGQSLFLSPSNSIQRYFSIQAANSTGLSVTLETTYWGHELAGLRKSQLGAFSATSVNGPWQPMASSNDSTANKVTVTGLTQLNGVWTLGRATTVLAVQSGVGDQSVADFRVYPTQLTDDELQYQFTGKLAADATLSIYNTLGQQVVSQLAVRSTTGRLTLPTLAAGWYSIRLLTRGSVYVARFYR
ncbi:FG-GAP-like repeat-containing protein [Hymenobacter sp. DH14]|uniref:FG-GAP-like repeat-containing protein n=1 Tax=Hymenobacter cyanobacteriorum TaxID=2926463 RepID=A0A9X2AFF8_9BACT|nr:FG-GAP-like repeat-containing protein [Hymenobacter cyanobacteriorum]MCI1188166.1 FG-GAP-like repeat-containing protein [Hymenobacter cyanobacteriorum]